MVNRIPPARRRVVQPEGLPPILSVRHRDPINTLYQAVTDAATLGARWLAELALAELLGPSLQVDEVALLLPGGSTGDEWFKAMLSRVGQRDITYFNQSDDKVQCHPLPSNYTVRYDFFSTELGVRLELLRLQGGNSPLHSMYSGRNPTNASVVHASFKCPNLLAYEDTLQMMRVNGWTCAQSCKSAYGLFGYWARNEPQEGEPMLFLKPRVNVRDMPGQAPAEPTDDEEDEPEEEEDEEEF